MTAIMVTDINWSAIHHTCYLRSSSLIKHCRDCTHCSLIARIGMEVCLLDLTVQYAQARARVTAPFPRYQLTSCCSLELTTREQ